MGESPSFLSNLGGRYELLTAGITFAAFVGFAKSVPAGFHISNRNMMKSGMLFSFACASYYWHRGGTQATYGGESQSLLEKLRQLSSYFPCICFLALASVFAYFAWLS